MVAKMLEIRDRGTFIPMLAIQLGTDVEQERWLASVAGFGMFKTDQEKYVVLVKLNGGEPCDAHIDPYAWGQDPRTYFVAHSHIIENFDKLQPGQVVDVEYVLAESEKPKETDRNYVYHPIDVG